MRIKLYCEGRTERGIRELLAPVREELRGKGRGLDVLSLQGNAQLLKKLGAKVRESIRSGDTIAVFCLIDLRKIDEALPPELKAALGGQSWVRMPIRDRVAWLQDNVGRHLVDVEYRDRFRLFVAVHEVEALVLADPGPLRKKLRQNALGPWPNPEEVNDEKPPAAVLNELFRKHHPRRSAYHKTKDGVPLLQSLDLGKVCSSCPYFRQLVDALHTV